MSIGVVCNSILGSIRSMCRDMTVCTQFLTQLNTSQGEIALIQHAMDAISNDNGGLCISIAYINCRRWEKQGSAAP